MLVAFDFGHHGEEGLHEGDIAAYHDKGHTCDQRQREGGGGERSHKAREAQHGQNEGSGLAKGGGDEEGDDETVAHGAILRGLLGGMIGDSF